MMSLRMVHSLACGRCGEPRPEDDDLLERRFDALLRGYARNVCPSCLTIHDGPPPYKWEPQPAAPAAPPPPRSDTLFL